MDRIYEKLRALVDTGILLEGEPMSRHTNFKIGGPCDCLYNPRETEELIAVLQAAKAEGIPVTVIGNGSNLLVSDKGIRGLVVKIAQGFDRVEVEGSWITAQSGVLLSKLASIALRASLAGMEDVSGIPGTLGGAVYMNAGAYSGEMKDVVRKTVYLNERYEVCTIEGEEHRFEYRKSIFSGTKDIILESTLQLRPGNATEISGRMKELAQRRRDKQPLEFPSAGSTFKRPEGDYASRLIDAAGLRGLSVGGAQVSEKHAGFVINTGNATFSDVIRLIEQVQEEVFRQFQVHLEPEVRIIGERT